MREFSLYTFHMDYDFQISQETLRIPSTAYRPVKRCSFCQSVFINEKNCESCGRSILYHPIGAPFSKKSFYGIKESYIESFNGLNRFFPILENKQSSAAKSYVRKLEKRFSDLLSAFNSPGMIVDEERNFFCIESMGIIDELLRHGISSGLLQALLLENDNSLEGQELLIYIQETSLKIFPEKTWIRQLLEYRAWGMLRIEYCLRVFIITATIITMAVKYKEIISSQFGR